VAASLYLLVSSGLDSSDQGSPGATGSPTPRRGAKLAASSFTWCSTPYFWRLAGQPNPVRNSPTA